MPKLSKLVWALAAICSIGLATNLFLVATNFPISLRQQPATTSDLIVEKHWWWGLPAVIQAKFGQVDIENIGNPENGGLSLEESMLYAYPLGKVDTQNAPLDFTESQVEAFSSAETYEMKVVCESVSGFCNLTMFWNPGGPVETAVLLRMSADEYWLVDKSLLPDQVAR